MCCFINPLKFHVPFVLNKYFEGRMKFSLELGFGNGDFMFNLSQKEPQYGYLGIEISSRSVLKLTRKLIASGIDNVKVIKIDAFLLLSVIEPESSIDRVIYNFPDPWPDRPGRRVTSRWHLLLIHRILKQSGVFYLSTDSDILKEGLQKYGNEFFVVERREKPYFDFVTKYQQKWVADKRNIAYYRLRPKRITNDYEKVRVKGDKKMSHVIFERKGNRIVLPVLPKRYEDEEYFVMIQKPYEKEGEFLFPILVKEKGFVQKTFFKLYSLNNEARLVLDDTSYIVVTPGIRKAMAYLKNLLLDSGSYRIKRDATI